MSRTLRSGILLVVLLIHAPDALAESVELRWQFKKGQALKYQLKHREVRTVAIGDQKLETVTTTEYEWQWTVKDVDDQGVATLGHKFTALRVESSGKDFDFRYDSAQGNQSQDDYTRKLIHLYDQVRFGEYSVRLRPDGRLAGVTGFDKLLGEIAADPAILDFHALNLHDDTFAWYLQHALGVLPAKAAAAGAKWEHAADGKVSPLGQFQGKTEYVFGKATSETGDACQVIQFTGSQTVDLDMKWLNNSVRGPLKVTKLAGTLHFDPKVHALRRGSAEIELGGELLFGNETNPAKMKIKFQHTLELEAK